jgi:hypothetical protein
MGPRINDRVTDLHRALIEADCGDQLILKADLERLIMEAWNISIATSRFYIDTGRALDLWKLKGDLTPDLLKRFRGNFQGPTCVYVALRESP